MLGLQPLPSFNPKAAGGLPQGQGPCGSQHQLSIPSQTALPWPHCTLTFSQEQSKGSIPGRWRLLVRLRSTGWASLLPSPEPRASSALVGAGWCGVPVGAMRVADGPGCLGLAHRPAGLALHSPHPGPNCLEWSGAPPLRPAHLPGSHWTAQVTDSAGGPLRAAFHLSPKADAVFSNSTICFLPPLCLFIYLFIACAKDQNSLPL